MSATRKRLGRPKANWENVFAALTKFKAREGHCGVPTSHIEEKYKLGQWVSKQRTSADTMSPKHRKRLNGIGFVWNRREDAWQRGFAALTKFKARQGHCLVPRFHVLGPYKLGQWVSVQRYHRDIIPAKLRKRLDAIGFVWDCREDAWEIGFAALTKFKAREGHCRVPTLHIERKYKLGQWVTVQRRKKDKMPDKRRKRLNKIGFVWRAYSGA
jgi:Helicase associated domain